MNLIEVFLWGTKVGDLSYQTNQDLPAPVSTFTFTEQAQDFGIEISPLFVNSK